MYKKESFKIIINILLIFYLGRRICGNVRWPIQYDPKTYLIDWVLKDFFLNIGD